MRSRPMLVSARVTAAEKALVMAAAEAEGLTVAEFILRAVLERAEQALKGRTGAVPSGVTRVQRRTA